MIGSVAAVSALSGAPGVSGPAHASGTPGNVRVPSVARAWAYATGGSVYSSPAVAGGTVYVGSNDGQVYALNARPDRKNRGAPEASGAQPLR